MPLEGLEEVNAKFKQALQDISVSRTQRFITEVLFAIQADAATMTPVDTSFLINSAYNKIWQSPGGWNGEVGYGANYAKYVHNAPGKLVGTGLAWNPDAEPQFLAKAVKNVIAQDLDRIIEQQYRI